MKSYNHFEFKSMNQQLDIIEDTMKKLADLHPEELEPFANYGYVALHKARVDVENFIVRWDKYYEIRDLQENKEEENA